MNSFITIELNNFLSGYVREHTITGNPQLDQRLIIILVSLVTTYTAVVLAFGTNFVKDRYNTFFNKIDYLKKNKDLIAHVKINCPSDIYVYMKNYVPTLKLNVKSNLFKNKNEENEISFCIIGDGNNKKSPWQISNTLAKLPSEEKIDKVLNNGISDQWFVKFEDRNINIVLFKHDNGNYYYHLFIEKKVYENIENIYKIVNNLLTNAKDFYSNKNKDVKYTKIELYEIIDNAWKNTAVLNEKTSETIIGQKCRDIFTDVKFFENDLSKIYRALDISYKRGYLLHGPAGTGKTSVIKSVASFTKKNIYKITFNEEGLGDDDYKRLLADTPINSIVLLEDIDPKLLQESGFIDKTSIVKSKNKDSSDFIEKKLRVSYNTLLDALDGINPNSGRITFITTNHPNKMGRALLRAGRIDKKYKLDYATNEEIVEYFHMYYIYFKLDNTKIDEGAERFIKNIRDHKNGSKISFAQLQQFLIQYLDDIDKVVENTHKMFENEEFEEYV